MNRGQTERIKDGKKPVTVRGLVIGEGNTKICVPITGETEDEIIKEATDLIGAGADMAEWRVDCFLAGQELEDREERQEVVLGVLPGLRDTLGDIPLLFTFRTEREGGRYPMDTEEYEELNRVAVRSGSIDLLDVELMDGEDIAAELICEAREAGVKSVISNHDFTGTPEQEELLSRFRWMEESGADILKIAVMPRDRKDVAALMLAAYNMKEYTEKPMIAISMGELGQISRLVGKVIGSDVTFGAVGKASAPGQASMEEMREVLSW